MLQHLLNPSLLLLVLQMFVLFTIFILFMLRNVLLSVLTLICLFVLVCFCFIFFDAVYLSLVFIIVYVGAIAVLFLFVIMLTNRIYSRGYNFWLLFLLMGGSVLLLDTGFLGGFSFLSGDLYWFTANYELRVLGDLRIRLIVANDPLVLLGFTFFNSFGLYLLALGLLLVIVLVGIVLLLRTALGNTLVVNRVMETEQSRWRHLGKFRDFIRLKTHD